MKRFIYYTLICCAAIALGACTHTDELDSIQTGDGQITITTLLGDQVATRAADTNVERTVKHIDVFVVKSDGDGAGSVVHYERSAVGNNNGAAEDGAGTLTLSVSCFQPLKCLCPPNFLLLLPSPSSLCPVVS